MPQINSLGAVIAIIVLIIAVLVLVLSIGAPAWLPLGMIALLAIARLT